MKYTRVILTFTFLISVTLMMGAQQVEVDGTLKVTQMSQDNSQENLVIQNDDGTLGLRQSASIAPPPEIDTSRNLASDFELAKLLCDCQNLPPFMIRSLLESGYSENDLIEAGIPFSNIQNAEAIVDGDGNEYTAITIGTQIWLRENLKTTSQIDGTPITLSTSSSGWSTANNAGTPSYSYVNNSNSNTEDYGLLYNWHTVENNEVCPIGYGVPTISDFQTLSSFLGSNNAVLIKERGYEFWSQSNQASTNSSGFSARGSGLRYSNWGYLQFEGRANWWTATESGGDNTQARFAEIWSSATNISTNSFGRLKGYGHSIRCIKY